MRSSILPLLILLPLSASAASNHRNAQAAASCSLLFADAGEWNEADFFASLGEQEAYRDHDVAFARARLLAHRGLAIHSEVSGAITTAKPALKRRAARVLIDGAAELLRTTHSMRYSNAGMAIRTAIDLDPSLRDSVEAWVISVVRAELTPRNSLSVMQLVSALIPHPMVDAKRHVTFTPVPHVAQLQLAIAERALQMQRPYLASAHAAFGLNSDPSQTPKFASVFARTARLFASSDPASAREAASIALGRDPSLWSDEDLVWLYGSVSECGKKTILTRYLERFPAGRHAAQARSLLAARQPECVLIGGFCGVGEVPFGRHLESESDERFFPGSTDPPSLLRTERANDFASRAAVCRALAPPLFPEPFDSHRMGVNAEEEIDPKLEELPSGAGDQCVVASTYDMEIDRDGRVSAVRIIDAKFVRGEAHDRRAIAAEEQSLAPILRSQRYRPANIRGVPVRGRFRGGVMRNCE